MVRDLQEIYKKLCNMDSSATTNEFKKFTAIVNKQRKKKMLRERRLVIEEIKDATIPQRKFEEAYIRDGQIAE